jgi:anti-sigma factor RsiW
MSRCPSERALARVFAGAGSAADEAHLARCPACDQRYRRLADDVARIGFVLEQAAAARVTPRLQEQVSSNAMPRRWRRSRVVVRPWSWGLGAAAVAATAALAVLVSDVPTDRRTSRATAPASSVAPSAMRAAVRDVSSALFQLGEDAPTYQVPRPRSPSSYVQAALEGGGPCRRVGSAVACE